MFPLTGWNVSKFITSQTKRYKMYLYVVSTTTRFLYVFIYQIKDSHWFASVRTKCRVRVPESFLVLKRCTLIAGFLEASSQPAAGPQTDSTHSRLQAREYALCSHCTASPSASHGSQRLIPIQASAAAFRLSMRTTWRNDLLDCHAQTAMWTWMTSLHSSISAGALPDSYLGQKISWSFVTVFTEGKSFMAWCYWEHAALDGRRSWPRTPLLFWGTRARNVREALRWA